MNRWFYVSHWGFDNRRIKFVEISDSKKHSSKHSIYAKNNNTLNISILHVDKTENNFTGIIGDVIKYENGICIRRRQDFVSLREIKGVDVLTETSIM